MVEIKGSVVNDAVKAVKAGFGEEAFKKIFSLLGEDTKKLFERSIILPSEWCPLDAFTDFLDKDIKVTANGNEKELIARSEALIEKQLRGIYKLFAEFGSAAFVLKRVTVINQAYFRGVSSEVKMSDSNKAVLKYMGFEKQHKLIGLSIIGFYRKALELAGATNVAVEYTTPIEANKGYCEFTITWDGK
jgi:hypothetical protein